MRNERSEQSTKIYTQAPRMKLNHVLFVVREQTETNAMAQRWQQCDKFGLSKWISSGESQTFDENQLAKCESFL